MLTNEFGEKWSKRFKHDFFDTQMALMSNRLELPFFVHYVLAIIMFWLNMSIFFVTNPLTPQIFNDSTFSFYLQFSNFRFCPSYPKAFQCPSRFLRF